MELYVVVVTEDTKVLAVIGPTTEEIEAQALSDVIRLGPNRRATVHSVRELNAIDVHGTEMISAWQTEIERR